MRLLGWLVAAALLVSACTASTPATTTPGQPGDGATIARTSSLMAMALTDVRSGERFTLSDFKGKVTIVEGMAVW